MTNHKNYSKTFSWISKLRNSPLTRPTKGFTNKTIVITIRIKTDQGILIDRTIKSLISPNTTIDNMNTPYLVDI